MFASFAGARAFVNRIGAIAEEQGHHPDIYMTWGKGSVEIGTHKIDGLTESDFILAAKFDEVPVPDQTKTAGSHSDDADDADGDGGSDDYNDSDADDDFDSTDDDFDDADR